VSSFDRARDAVDFVTATIDSLAGVVENAIFSINLVDGGAPASGIVFTEDITKVAESARSICCRTWLVSSCSIETHP